ncbi:MAG: hypothetical protein AAF959_11760 [Cyanobacteria bacterium P01_D01_bin.56]
MAVLPTVKVALGDDYMIINEHDFDPNVHTLFDVKPGASSPRELRQQELLAMSWQKIRAVAEGFQPPVEKHEDGWEETIPSILDREFSNPE